jgi:hypothetical protein
MFAVCDPRVETPSGLTAGIRLIVKSLVSTWRMAKAGAMEQRETPTND